ncbi:MAG: hypothetical protein WD844_06595 [Thermoleophilaceae bacterium]
MSSLACLLALTFAAGAGGNAPRPLEVVLQDDAHLLHGTPAQVGEAAGQIASAGADRVRITAGWSTIAPSPRSRRRPHFDATDPAAYPEGGWRRLDRAVKAAHTRDLDVMIDIAFWAPRWAVSRGLERGLPARQRWAPSWRDYGHFAEAVARRYSGVFPDPDDPDRPLPAVRLWTTWNEPNHQGFLLPQWRRTRTGWRPAAPHVYRRMHQAAYDVLKRVSPDNRVLVGGLAAKGSSGRGERVSLPPLRFTRELACVDEEMRPLRIPECRNYRPLRADGFAIHPYSLDSTPDASNPNLDTTQIGDLDRLAGLLERLHANGRLAQELPLFVTEYGYETNPPDPKRGVSPEDQARYLGQATFLAWQRGDTEMFAQFLLRDIGPDPRFAVGSGRRWRDWQSGLYTHDGEEKPALQAFKLPFWVETRKVHGHPLTLVFGQIRPGAGRQAVVLELQDPDGAWREARSFEARPNADTSCETEGRSFLTDSAGFYLRVLPWRGERAYRARWLRADGGVEYGLPVTSGPADEAETTPVSGAP